MATIQNADHKEERVEGSGTISRPLVIPRCDNIPGLMCVNGTIGGHSYRVVFVSGSAHNFVSHRVIEESSLELESIGRVCEFKISIGTRLKSDAICRGVRMEMQGMPTCFDAYVTASLNGGYEIILGVQWLRTLGPIAWNFKDLQMKFKLNGVEHTLQGE